MRHAHGYGVQTLADLGRIGVALSLLASRGVDRRRDAATGLRRRDRGRPFDPERIGLLTMATVVVVFGAHSLIDWTWFVPGNAVRRAAVRGVGGRPRAAAHARQPTPMPAAARRSRGGARRAALALGALAVLVRRAGRRAGRRCSPCARRTRPTTRSTSPQLGKYDAAAAKARRAGELNPLSVDPLFLLAFIDDARGDKHGAKRALERATRLQPANVEAWRRLGRYRLSVLDDPRARSTRSGVAFYLDPASDRGPVGLPRGLARARRRRGGC